VGRRQSLQGGRRGGRRRQRGRGRREGAKVDLHGVGEDVCHARWGNGTGSGHHVAQ
jgi:hypothetical protein